MLLQEVLFCRHIFTTLFFLLHCRIETQKILFLCIVLKRSQIKTRAGSTFISIYNMQSAQPAGCGCARLRGQLRLCSASCNLNAGSQMDSFINLASGGHLIRRLSLEAQLQSASLKWEFWTASNTKDMLSASEVATEEVRSAKLCAVTQSYDFPLRICLFGLSEPPAHWDAAITETVLLNADELNLLICLVGPVSHIQS